MKRVLKVKHKEGVYYRGNIFEYIGDYKPDGFPMYSFNTEDIDHDLNHLFPNFVFNCLPGYTPISSDFELMSPYEVLDENFKPRKNMTERYYGKNILGTDDIIPVQPLNGPIGKLYYFDYVYESELDNRLLLML
jgi:hypothetical protein